jgi:hypothetical protein
MFLFWDAKFTKGFLNAQKKSPVVLKNRVYLPAGQQFRDCISLAV